MSRRNRLLEVALSVGASIFSTLVLVTWTLSAKLESFNQNITSNKAMIADQNSKLATAEATNASQTAQLAVAQSRYDDIVRRLDSIESKVDRIASRERQ